MVALEEKYIAGDWIPPFPSVSVDCPETPSISDTNMFTNKEPTSATDSRALSDLANKAHTTDLPLPSISPVNAPTTEPPAKKCCKGKLLEEKFCTHPVCLLCVRVLPLLQESKEKERRMQWTQSSNLARKESRGKRGKKKGKRKVKVKGRRR